MMHNTSLQSCVVILGAIVLTCPGCASSQPSRFYLLSPMAEPGDGKPTRADLNEITVGIGPVELPAYVDRPQIVTRSGDNRLYLAEYDRWGEPLKEGVARVLAENLSAVVGADHIVLFPWKASEAPDCQIIVNVTRFDSTAAGTAVLTARWSILQKGEQHKTVRRQSAIQKDAGAQSYEGIVAAESWTVAELSKEIAAAIEALLQDDRTP